MAADIASAGVAALDDRVVPFTVPDLDIRGRVVRLGPSIELLEPLDHLAMIAEMRRADVVLSDSGGVQEEAPALGVPLLVLREQTERPEGIASGNILLAGTDRDRIVALVLRLTDPTIRAAMSRPSLPFGDGMSGPRIAATMIDWIDRRHGQLRKAG
jgi:UDP-N-acetylglucosamine 2-epimerase (non-hydrolysing)